MPSKKPFVRRFGQVDFDSMIPLLGAAADDTDIFVTRRGAFGANRTLTRAQIVAGAGGVPDPLLLNDGAVGAPTYSFTSDPTSGVFLDGAGILALATGGFKIAQTQDGGAGVRQFIVSPTTPQNNPAAPSLAFGDGNTGFFESADDTLVVSIAGAGNFSWSGLVYGGGVATSGGIINEAASAANPTLLPNRADVDTGLGQSADNKFSLIAFGIEVARVDTIAGPVSQFIVAPGVIQNNAGAPSLAFGDGDSGFFESADDTLNLALGSGNRYIWTALSFSATAAEGPAVLNEASLANNPTLVPRKTDPDTGIASAAADQLSLVAGGVEGIRITEAAAAITAINTFGPILAPGAGVQAAPNYSFADDIDSGFFLSGVGTLGWSVSGSVQFKMTDAAFFGSAPNSGYMQNVAPSATVSTLGPNVIDLDTGIGWRAADIGVLVAGGVNVMEFGESGAAPLCGFFGNAAVAKPTGVAVTDVAIHAALVTLNLIAGP